MCRDFKGPAHSHRCFQLFWLIRPFIRLKICEAIQGIMCGHKLLVLIRKLKMLCSTDAIKLPGTLREMSINRGLV